MEKIVKGVCKFQTEVFPKQQPEFEKLAHKQSPQALVITCADSRINPNLITQTEPGDLFLLRNAGNIVPAYGAANGGEGATIEYAVAVLKISHLIILGHSNCGAMAALMKNEGLEELPAVRHWFSHAEATRRLVQAKYSHITDPERLARLAIQENVLVQLDHLRTHPAVAVGLSRNELDLYGWMYTIETGEILSYDPAEHAFVPLERPMPISATRLGQSLPE